MSCNDANQSDGGVDAVIKKPKLESDAREEMLKKAEMRGNVLKTCWLCSISFRNPPPFFFN